VVLEDLQVLEFQHYQVLDYLELPYHLELLEHLKHLELL
jgi:hypothetical protein